MEGELDAIRRVPHYAFTCAAQLPWLPGDREKVNSCVWKTARLTCGQMSDIAVPQSVRRIFIWDVLTLTQQYFLIAVIGFSWLSAVAQLMIVARCPTSRRYQHQLLTSVPECKVNRLRLKPGKVLVHLLWSSVDPEDECKLQSQKALQHKISPSFFEHPIILTYHSYKGWVDTFDTRTKSAKKSQFDTVWKNKMK